MATLARLAGAAPAVAEHCRVLEIGCGDGGNLSAAAVYLPSASFVGFDLAAGAIEEGKRAAPPNVRLFEGDICAVGDLGKFDYVIAHGLYSWVPEPVKAALLTLIHDSLAPNGIGFLSFNALPGWKYRETLRDLALDRGRMLTSPADRVKTALALVDEIARGGKDAPGYLGLLAKHAESYAAHVREATPPDSPFAYYVFHDLLAETNDPYSLTEIESRLAAAQLRIICETPLRTKSLVELDARMSETELPFLQLLIRRDDSPSTEIQTANAGELFLWCDFAAAGPGAFRTSTGAVVRPPPGSGLAKAATCSPHFVRVRELDPDPRFAEQVLAGFLDGVFLLRSEPPVLPESLVAAPKRGVLTNAVHRSFRLSEPSIEVLRRLVFVR
jgi:SAM-dependent methyltransferase